jgi:GlpG protein
MLLADHIEDENGARVFSDFLYAQGIENEIERNKEGLWELWILDSDEVAQAREFLAEYGKDPGHSRYFHAHVAAQEKRAEARESRQRFQKRVFTRERVFGAGFKLWSATGVLIIISVAVTLLSMVKDGALVKPLYIADFVDLGDRRSWNVNLVEVQDGQIWRLVTPIFLHFGLAHIVLNMLWLMDLGYRIERTYGTLCLLGLVLLFAVTSNLAQFWVDAPGILNHAFCHGPRFGGMSGVVYGLLGYVWISGVVNPWSRMSLPRHIVIVMILWFFVCLTGWLGPIANTAHGVGLLVGMAAGLAAGLIQKSSHWRRRQQFDRST